MAKVTPPKAPPAKPPEDDEDETSEELVQPNAVFKNRWEVVTKPGSGGFGQIHIVKDRKTKITAALKLEKALPKDQSQLPMELQVLRKCQGQKHAITIFSAAASFRGTMRYCSVTSHQRHELGRKDVYEFWTGDLPWKDQNNHKELIEAKQRYSLQKLAGDLHPQLVRFIDHVDKLKCQDKPAY